MKVIWQVVIMAMLVLTVLVLANCGDDNKVVQAVSVDQQNRVKALTTFDQGQQTFRFDTFGDEAFWGDTLKLHQGVATVSPRTALAVGLKVDVDALTNDLINQLKSGSFNLDDPVNTLALLKLNAVLGVTGFFNSDGTMRSIGIQCALCHSTVDDSLAAGIGHRLDGWANQDLNVGAIINLAPDAGLINVANLLGVPLATVRAVLSGWGPGKFDAELFMDGKGANGSGIPGSSATLIPAAYGLAGVNLHTSTGWGSVTHWNAFVAVLEMHGKGTFYDPRLNNPTKFPIAANPANKFYDVRQSSPEADLVTSKLPALQFYQLALQAPAAPATAFDATRAASGKVLFVGKAGCARCHVPPIFTEPGWNMHTAAEIGIDDFQATRSPDGQYRTPPLKGIWVRETRPAGQKRGFFHDGRFPGLLDVVNHYDTFLALGLTDTEKGDLVEYLKSL